MDKDMVGLNDGHNTILVNVHTIDQCNGQPCCIHNPSQHHMADWPPQWDDTMGVMMRRCRHGFDHPDPDDVGHRRRTNRIGHTVHVCDSCCQP